MSSFTSGGVRFKWNKLSGALVDIAVERAERLKLLVNDSISLRMDLIATSSNGCPLDFRRLLTFDDFSFAHDISGIQDHIDRETGKLSVYFLPRCASCVAPPARRTPRTKKEKANG